MSAMSSDLRSAALGLIPCWLINFKTEASLERVFLREKAALTKTKLFQSFQWFDGLTMSGFILNCFAPVKALRRFKVQSFLSIYLKTRQALVLPHKIREDDEFQTH